MPMQKDGVKPNNLQIVEEKEITSPPGLGEPMKIIFEATMEFLHPITMGTNAPTAPDCLEMQTRLIGTPSCSHSLEKHLTSPNVSLRPSVVLQLHHLTPPFHQGLHCHEVFTLLLSQRLAGAQHLRSQGCGAALRGVAASPCRLVR